MKESPIFQQIKGAGMTSAQPLKEAFTQWVNLKRVLISLFGATAGQGVVWYTGQFYALFYLQTILKVNSPFGQLHRRDRTAARDAVICLLRSSFGSHRAQTNNDGRMFARGGVLHSHLSRDAARGRFEVVTADSKRNEVTGAISLTPQTLVDGASQPAKEVLPYSSFATLIATGRVEADPAGVYPGGLRDDGLRSDCSLPGRSISREDPLHGAVVAVSHRQRCFRWPAAVDRPLGNRETGNIYAGLYYPIIVAGLTFISRLIVTEGDQAHTDLGRGQGRRLTRITRI